jgi:arsenite methyltransferase
MNTLTNEQLKQSVKDMYAKIATQTKQDNAASCCGAGGCSTEVYNIMSDDYTQLKGYNPDADLSLGCGLPIEHAMMKSGDTVLDLGSGAGNDCFIARAIIGDSGKVIGVDMTETMIDLARENADKLGLNNVEFRLGEIEKLPITANKVDVVVSNCVLNLVPDKEKAFSEIYRVLKPGAHLSISDVVLVGELPEKIKSSSEMYAGCVSGALQKTHYIGIIKQTGFVNVKVQKEKPIIIPDDILLNYLSKEEVNEYRASGKGIFSITVYAEKPAENKQCIPGGGCC